MATALRAALLRAVNVGGRPLPMADLRALVETAGFDRVQTLLQSGNVVFGGAGKPDAIEQRLEAAARDRLKLATDFFVRDTAEWSRLVADNPFPAEAKSDPAHLVVTFLKKAPTPAAVKALQETAAARGREILRAAGRHLYVVYPDGIGRSKLTIALIEKQLGTRGTARNWNTVLKMSALLAG